AATGALRDAEDDADAGAIELVAQDSVPASRYCLARKRIEVECGAVHIESFVLQEHVGAVLDIRPFGHPRASVANELVSVAVTVTVTVAVTVSDPVPRRNM